MQAKQQTTRLAIRFGPLACVAALMLAGALADRAGAQPAIPWWSIEGGGAMFSTSSGIRLGATIGQHDAGVMTGGAITLRGGFWAVAAMTPPCPGDADGDGDVDRDDIDFVLFNFPHSVPPGTNSDLDGNGVVNQDDIDLVLFYYGTNCS